MTDMYSLANGIVSISVSGKGAELSSLRKNGTEYLWKADSSVWNRSAPQLFPIVGTLNGNEYRYEGRSYHMTRHGFARDTEFEVSGSTGTSVCFEMHDSPATLASYPFPFLFAVEYTLSDSTLVCTWRVKNTGRKVMYFSVGGHPAFLCPPGGASQGRFSDCMIKCTGDRALSDITFKTIDADGLLQARTDTYSLEDGILRITEDMFSHDALILENSGIHSISLCDSRKSEYLRVGFESDIVGLWSPRDKHAPFLCIEPWYGRCDREGFSGELKDREWGNTLEPGKTFEKSFSVTVI